MAFFVPGKVFELQKWTEDESLNGKIVGIIDKKNAKQCYPCYIFETQQIVEATAAQLTYPDLDANNKKKLVELLQDVIDQKKNHQINLAIKAEEEEKRKLLLKQQREEQQKIQAVIPNVVFDTGSTSPRSATNGELQSAQSPQSQPRSSVKSTTSNQTQIVIQAPPKDLYKVEDTSTDGLLIEEQESTVPAGYALVPVSTLNEVVKIKGQEQELQKKEIELISKENELSLAEKEQAMAAQRKEMELQAKQKEIEMEKKNLGEMEKDIAQREHKTQMHTDRMMEEEIRRKQQNRAQEIERDRDLERERMRIREKEREMGNKGKKKKKRDRDRDRDDDDYEDRKRKKKKKKKKRKKKDEGCTTTKCCKCLCKLSSIFIILAIIGGLIGCYFFFLQNDEQNIFAFIAWAGAVVCAVFGVCFYCKG